MQRERERERDFIPFRERENVKQRGPETGMADTFVFLGSFISRTE
jgi:hypothetical protein